MNENPYSYRNDPAVPAFDDTQPVLVFDGVCVLCSRGVRLIHRIDKRKQFRFLPVQSALGRALYVHYGLDPDHYESFMMLADGQAFFKADGFLEVARRLGGVYRLAAILKIVPRTLRNKIYDLIAHNRYNWFGTTGYCKMVPPEMSNRLLDYERAR